MFLLVICVSQFVPCVSTGYLCELVLSVCFLLVICVSQFFLYVFTGGFCEPVLSVCFYWGVV